MNKQSDSIKERLFEAADQITIYNQTHNGILDNPLDDLYIAIKSLPDKQIDLDAVAEKIFLRAKSTLHQCGESR